MWMIIMRVVQGIGAAFLMANSSAILTDAFPAEERGTGARDQHGRRDRRIVHRTCSWGRARARGVAAGVPGVGAVRAVRHRVGLPEARGARDPQAREDRLVGQRDVRGRADRGARRNHLRDPALRRAQHGLDGAGRDRRACRRHRPAGGVRGDRAPRRVADVPARPVQDPGVQRRKRRDVPGGAVPRRADVHADPLAPGDLVAAARIQLQGHAAVGRHLHAAAVGRVPGRRADLRTAGRPLRRAAVRHRGHDRLRDRIPAVDRAPDQFHLLAVRARDLPDRRRDGPVRRSEPDRDHEQPPSGPARVGRGDGRDVPELRVGALDRRVLQPDHRRPVLDARPRSSTTGWRRTACRSTRPRRSRICRRSAACSRRSSATTRWARCSRGRCRTCPTRLRHT